MTTEGSLCTGYNGLGLAVADVLGTELAWVSEVDPSARAVLDARFPGVPNLGDLTATDWTKVEPVDVLTAGYDGRSAVYYEDETRPDDALPLYRLTVTEGKT